MTNTKLQHTIETLSIHGGRVADPTTGAVVTPIYQTTTYAQEGIGKDKGHTYSRASNPTVTTLEAALGELEAAPPGVCFSTGMAAITTLLISLVRGGEHVIVSDVIYGGTVRLLREVLADQGVSTTFVDASDPAAVESAIRPQTRLILIETPGNPTLKLTDIAAVSSVAKRHRLPLAVDNTFLTAALLRPLDLGADISVYSTTKYVDGHNATVGGAIVTRDEALLERLQRVRKTIGTIQSPHNAWLTLQGMKTLPLRLRAHSAAATVVAQWLEAHDLVTRVAYPGLPSFAQRELALRQHGEHHGGLLAFELSGGHAAAEVLLSSFELCTLAENLGSVETLVTHPASMTHGDVPRDQRERAGISDGLIRLSVGLEHPADLIRDLERALSKVAAAAEEAVA